MQLLNLFRVENTLQQNFPVLKLTMGVQYMLSMMRKCIMVKLGGKPKKKKERKHGGNLYIFLK